MTTEGELLSTYEVVEGTDVTFRMLDYWIRNGVIVPDVEASGSGSRRRFTAEQAQMVWTLGRVQAALNRSQSGVSTVLLGEVCDAMERGEHCLALGHGVFLSWEPQW
jgi:DNA-binding transcriptional MerR regulator